MNRKKQIEPTIRKRIDELLEASGKKFSSGDLRGSLDVALQAWDLIPEPKSDWDYCPQSLSVGFVQDFADLGDKESVSKWSQIMAEMYGDPNHEDQLVLMTEGEAMYKLGDKDRAYYIFGRIHEIYGQRGFSGDQSVYFEFYRKEKAARGE
ncbi:hypothetical protein EHI47_18545 [Rhizobium leguminosarum]|jgi:hypothetical protein|uniref:Tetratricopeptide repeat protein n=2 Tax=Rhizobium TaxID=379 RepID=A0A444HXA0_RHILE|nr:MULTISPECIES: hypothetical protein [Rhizobium]MBY5461059.1 hypothetical protein [Rhizobium leguminosarum]NKL65896.1 hypothetical protein [Rhizobium leguminosarum bv. viciae]RWX09531.1 hypothetical protein EHI45_22125 [Rhizobium leguminosarum]RWX28698.1 hypothetical protein EHI47_18545 [Rhizobium leguminosarum]TAU54915.1 hypothetical protein ELI43_19870 [Rhizobium leguminosarum]